MKRGFKVKKDSNVDKIEYSTLLSAIDKHIDDLQKNSSEIEDIMSLLENKQLSASERTSLGKALEEITDLSSNIRRTMGEN